MTATTKPAKAKTKASASTKSRSKAAKFLPPPTRAIAVAEEIRKRILDGRYTSGMQLRQDALAEEYGVSRIPVREALVQLEAEGLLTIHAHRGAVVTEFSIEGIGEFFVFRALIEPFLLQKSAPNLTASDFAALDTILAEYSKDLRAMKVGRWGDLNGQLHSLLYSHANSPRIEATAQQLLQSTDRFTRMQLYYTDGREQAEQEHERIVRLCKAKDFPAAAAELRQHIINAGTALIGLLRARQGAASEVTGDA